MYGVWHCEAIAEKRGKKYHHESHGSTTAEEHKVEVEPRLGAALSKCRHDSSGISRSMSSTEAAARPG